MDEVHHDDTPLVGNVQAVDSCTSRLHPVISWEQAGRWTEIALQLNPSEADGCVVCPIECSKETFVLRLKGPSMEPRFVDGELIFVDPKVEATDGRFVVVRLRDANEATFRQLIVEDGRRYLQALNRDWPSRRIIENNENTVFCGVVVFRGEAV